MSRYDRELMGTTLRAMQRVGEIRARREEMFFERRMKEASKVKVSQAKAELKESIELLVPAAADKEKVLLNVVEAAKLRASAKKQSKEAAAAKRGAAAAAADGDMSD
jgi:large subunit ribosomal protein L24e